MMPLAVVKPTITTTAGFGATRSTTAVYGELYSTGMSQSASTAVYTDTFYVIALTNHFYMVCRMSVKAKYTETHLHSLSSE